MQFLRRIFDRQYAREMKQLTMHVKTVKAQMPEDIVAAHIHAARHRDEVLSSELCGCFYCGKVFPPAEIVDWTDGGKTALCPKCGIDSVLGAASGFPVTGEFLGEMNKHWF
jgi:hypothetical protein